MKNRLVNYAAFVVFSVICVSTLSSGQDGIVSSSLDAGEVPMVLVMGGSSKDMTSALESMSLLGSASDSDPAQVEDTSSTTSTTSTTQPTTTTSTTSKPTTTPKPWTSSKAPIVARTTRRPFTPSSSWTRTTKKPTFFDRQTTTAFPSLAEKVDDDGLSPEAKWKKFEDNVRNGIEGAMKQMMPQVMKMSSTGANFTAQCMGDFLKVIFGMKQLKGWALRLLDSAGRPAAGIFDGAITDFGDYDECVNIVATETSSWGPSAGTKREIFHGKYCTVLLQPALPPKPKSMQKGTAVVALGEDDSLLSILTESAHFFYHLRLRLGLCVPSSCFASDADIFMKEVWKHMGMKAEVNHCETKRSYAMEPHQIACMMIIVLVMLAVLIGTGADVVKTFYLTKEDGVPSANGKPMQIAIALSLYTNGKKLLNTSGGDKNMGALHGMRFISMTWVLLGHTYSYFYLSGFRGMKNLRDAPEDISFMAVLNGWVDVDTFFLLGGMALCYSILKKANGKRTMNVGFYLFHRYWRLAPTFGLVLAFSFLIPMMSSGPLWHDVVEVELDRCHKSWWHSLLFISNWFTLEEMCMQPTWYLSADFQLYLIALIVLIPLLRWPSIGMFINFFMILVSAITIAVITLYRGYPPSMTHVGPDAKFIEQMAVEIHWKPYTHLGPYCVGIALGYLVYKQKDMKIKPVMVVLGWLSATICSLAVLYGAYDWNNGRMPNEMVTVLYASCHRTAWAFSVGWVVFACIYGAGGVVNAFLSWKFFVPLSRLTFLMYLTHPIVMMVRIGSLREAHYFGHYYLAYFFVSHTVFTVGAAFLGSLFFEWPFAGLENIMLGRGATTTTRGGTNRPSDGQIKDDDLEKQRGRRSREELTLSKNGGFIKRFTVPECDEQGGPYVVGVNVGPKRSNNHSDSIVSRL